MRISFPGSQPDSLRRTSQPSQDSSRQAAPFQPVFSQESVLFGSKPENPPSSNPSAMPTLKKLTPEELAAIQKLRLKSIQEFQQKTRAPRTPEQQAAGREILRKRSEIAKQLHVDLSLKLPLPKQYYYGYVMNTSVVDFMGLTTETTKAAAQILDNSDDLRELWLRLGMPDSELPEADWENEVVVLVAQSRTHQTTLKPAQIFYVRQFDILTFQISPEEKPGKEPGMAWYLAIFPRVGQPTQEEQERLQKHQALYEKFQSLPEKEKPKALVTSPPPKLTTLSEKTKPNINILIPPKK